MHNFFPLLKSLKSQPLRSMRSYHKTISKILFSVINFNIIIIIIIVIIIMFVFKNKEFFGIHHSVSYSRTGGGLVAAYPGWTKHHSRLQGRYRGFDSFNKLPNYTKKKRRYQNIKSK